MVIFVSFTSVNISNWHHTPTISTVLFRGMMRPFIPKDKQKLLFIHIFLSVSLEQSQQHMESYLLEDWRAVEAELMRERGLWGPPVGSELDKWMLDLTEGPHRMRKKMMINDQFYINYPYRPPLDDNVSSAYKVVLVE